MRVWLALVFVLAVALPVWAGRVVVDWEYDYVNVRSSPSISGESVGRLSTGAEAERVKTQGEWAFVRFPGGEGWVVARSLQPLSESAPAPAPAMPTGADAAAAGVPLPGASAASDSEPDRPAEPPAPATELQPTGDPAPGYLAEYADPADAPVFDAGPSVISVISGLLIVLALIAGTVLLVRRLWLNRFTGGRRPSGIQILASRPVGARQALLLVEVGGLVWLVGQSQDGLRLIAPVEDDRALQRLNDRYEFLETPFESELKRNLDLESEERQPPRDDVQEAPDSPTAEQRLEALRRRSKPRERS